MVNRHRAVTRKTQRLVLILMACLWLSGCASLPPVIHYASMALSGVSYIATGKGPSDHALSFATHKDCTLLRALTLKPVCINVTAYTNKPVWVQLLKKNQDEFADNIPMPPRLIGLHDAEVVQLNDPPATPN